MGHAAPAAPGGPDGPPPREQASGLLTAAGVEISHEEGSATARIHLDDTLPTAALVGLLGDVTGGLLSLWTMAPLRTATSELSMHLSRTHVRGEVVATATVLRRRRHGLVLTIEVVDGSGARLGDAIVNFAVLGEARPPAPADEGPEPVPHAVTTIGSVLEFGVLTPSEDGADLSVVLADAQRNTFGALNGGLSVAAVSRAAAAAAGTQLGPGAAVVQLTQAFLAPARGPSLQIAARVVGRPTADLAVVQVTMADADRDDRQPVRATALVLRSTEAIGRAPTPQSC